MWQLFRCRSTAPFLPPREWNYSTIPEHVSKRNVETLRNFSVLSFTSILLLILYNSSVHANKTAPLANTGTHPSKFSHIPLGRVYRKYRRSDSDMWGSLWIDCPTRKASLCAYWQGAGTRIVPCKTNSQIRPLGIFFTTWMNYLEFRLWSVWPLVYRFIHTYHWLRICTECNCAIQSSGGHGKVTEWHNFIQWLRENVEAIIIDFWIDWWCSHY